MKRLLYYVLVAILLCGCGQREMSKNCAEVTNAMWQSDVINPMKEALERVALASIRISGDTEGEWA
jgi:hypothetical protein